MRLQCGQQRCISQSNSSFAPLTKNRQTHNLLLSNHLQFSDKTGLVSQQISALHSTFSISKQELRKGKTQILTTIHYISSTVLAFWDKFKNVFIIKCRHFCSLRADLTLWQTDCHNPLSLAGIRKNNISVRLRSLFPGKISKGASTQCIKGTVHTKH